MPLSDINIKNAKPKDKPYKLPDEKGMYLYVHPNGGKYFRLNYRFEGSYKTLALGAYPVTTLAKARELTVNAKRQIADGIDPATHKQAVKQTRAKNAANTLEVVANEWLLKKCKDLSPRPARHLGFILPWLGKKPIANIKPPELLERLVRVQENGAVYSAVKALQMYGQLWRYAVATNRASRDITQDIKGALETRKKQHFAAITEPKEAAQLLRDIDNYQGSLTTQCALKLAPLFFQRPGALRAARWQDFDFEAKEWRYHVTKTEVDQIVPLSKQACAILEQVRPLTGDGFWVFPSERNPNNTEKGRCLSENTLNAALNHCGYKGRMTVHGFRAMARTIMDEVLRTRVDFIEQQLAHSVKDPLGRAYNRTKHLDERHRMMQKWADYLDGIKAGADVISINAKKA